MLCIWYVSDCWIHVADHVTSVTDHVTLAVDHVIPVAGYYRDRSRVEFVLVYD